MKSQNLRCAAVFAVVLSSAFVAACTLLVNRDNVQCSSNGDCAKYSAQSVCSSGFCSDVTGTGIDGGDNGDGDTLGPPGCFAGEPTTDLEFLNRCTTAQYLRFDNCERLGMCSGTSETS